MSWLYLISISPKLRRSFNFDASRASKRSKIECCIVVVHDAPLPFLQLALLALLRIFVYEENIGMIQEPRYHALSKTDEGRLLHITFTLRGAGTLIRVVSARDMHRKERTFYDQAEKDST